MWLLARGRGFLWTDPWNAGQLPFPAEPPRQEARIVKARALLALAEANRALYAKEEESYAATLSQEVEVLAGVPPD
jgi:hypothetical protein